MEVVARDDEGIATAACLGNGGAALKKRFPALSQGLIFKKLLTEILGFRLWLV